MILFCNLCQNQLTYFHCNHFAIPIVYQYECANCNNNTFRTILSFNNSNELIHYVLKPQNDQRYFILSESMIRSSSFTSLQEGAVGIGKSLIDINSFCLINIYNLDEEINNLYLRLKKLIVLL